MALVSATFLKSCAQWDQWPSDDLGPCIAFWGRSNVGKSSLLNALLGAKAARVSKTPGRTQLLNLFVSPPPLRCLWCDLPGYGYAQTSQKVAASIAQRLEEYLLSPVAPQLLCWLVDARHGLTKTDWEVLPLVAELLESGSQVALISTKNDKLSRSQQLQNQAQLKKALPPTIASAITILPSSGDRPALNAALEDYLRNFLSEPRQAHPQT